MAAAATDEMRNRIRTDDMQHVSGENRIEAAAAPVRGVHINDDRLGQAGPVDAWLQ